MIGVSDIAAGRDDPPEVVHYDQVEVVMASNFLCT
jgi:hypothetical protein